jgi:4'-phosphopantetheinyl transferase EntD
MLGTDVGIGITDPHDPEKGLCEAELPAIARAVPKRRQEFSAGRRAARAAMAELDLPPAPIPMGAQREPLWPQGIVGSIAHCDTLCIAAISRKNQSIGLDIEPATPLPADLEDIICTPPERAWLDTLPPQTRGLRAKQIFSAKEAVYKAQYPLTGKVIGFDEVELRYDPKEGMFWDRFTTNLMPCDIKIAQVGGLTLSLCTTNPTGGV